MSEDHAFIDNNGRNTLSLWDDTTGTIQPAYIDPVTGALLIYVVGSASVTPASFNRAGIDGNDRNTICGWDDTTNAVEAFRCDSSGNLLVYLV